MLQKEYFLTSVTGNACKQAATGILLQKLGAKRVTYKKNAFQLKKLK